MLAAPATICLVTEARLKTLPWPFWASNAVIVNVSVPTGASMTSVLAGALRNCDVPPLTETPMLRAVAGTYFGDRAVESVPFQLYVKVTWTI